MGSRVVQDWVLVRAEDDGEIVQARLNWLAVRPEDRVLRVEARRVDTDATLLPDPSDPSSGPYRGPGPQPYRAYTRSAGERTERTRLG
ncbi:MAG: hypothetical protein FJ087_13300 [Deltaproteobacteria bacterium]|nr:hypothetical protein [Deltaproteobacteria bacterium]